MRVINSKGRENALAPNWRNSLPCTVKTSRLCNQRVGCLLDIMARIYDLLDGTLDKRQVRCLVPCCGQNGYRSQVPQHPIDSDT